MTRRFFLTLVMMNAVLVSWGVRADTPDGFVPLFDGKTLAGWTVPEGDNGHWKVLDGVIDYDGASEASLDKNLWTEKEYRDFVLLIDWRIKDTPYMDTKVPIVKPDGTHKLGADGKEIHMSVPSADSGVFVRGDRRSQVNIWCWPIGSGEVYGFRMNQSLPPEIRAGVTPKTNADNNIGEWNRFKITMRGDLLSVMLNGKSVLDNAQLPGIAQEGRIGLQHYGAKDEKGNWTRPPALIQFRNISIKELH